MRKIDVVEALPIVLNTLDALLKSTVTQGRLGSDLRSAIGETTANAERLLYFDVIDVPVTNCFDLAYSGGLTLSQAETVRRVAASQTAVSVGAAMTQNLMLMATLATMGYIIADMTFTSRDEVDQVNAMVNNAFTPVEEQMADQKESMVWRAIFKLHAAISLRLVETARPLQRMLSYRFNAVMPSIVLAHRLYADASRADELVGENHIVHPGFCLRQGRALGNG